MRLFRSVIRWVKSLFTKRNMRRKISLYIADQLVDLDDQSFILFNYQMDDLSNPAIVRNSFSQQITLPGTPNNNRIFGGSFRADRRVGGQGGNTGTDFNASRKTPFTIYDEMNEILESGYVKLDSVVRNGADIQYKVTLYGGLGSFFYALSYDDGGNKRTLADLTYLDTGNPDTELDFTINADAVQEAWARLRQETAPAKWDVINFALAYNGIPDGNFSPDKGLIDPVEVGLPSVITQGDGADTVNYTTKSGYALVNLAEAQDEWAVKDLRSYLQRPVFSMKAFLEAICNPDNNGGYEVDASVIQDGLTFGNFHDLWMTLPLLSSIGTIKQESGDLSLSMSTSATTGNSVGRYDISGSVPSGTRINASINCKIKFNVTGASATYLFVSAEKYQGGATYGKFNVLFVQAVAYGSDNSVIGGSKIKVVGGVGTSGADMARACGFTPVWAAEYEMTNIQRFHKVSGVYELPEMGFSVVAQDVSYYKILVSVYAGTSFTAQRQTMYSYSGNGRTSTPVLYQTYDTGYTADSAFIANGTTTNVITYTSSDSLRSGATITKAMLLSTPHTPAEYLLSFCKIFGLYFTYNNATRKVTILRRNDLYEDETIDLTRRVDTKGVEIVPLVCSSKWYDFLLEGVGGAFYDEYLQVEGVPYGIQRVNTGYDFNAEAINLMDSVVFKNACTILAKSKYFNIIHKAPTVDLETLVDISLYPSNHRYIASSGKWSNSSSALAVLIPVNPGENYRFHTPGVNSGIAAVLSDNSQTVGAAASFVSTYPNRFVITEGIEVTIPEDGHYIYMTLENSAGATDSSLYLVTRPSSVFQPSPFLDKGNTYTLWSADGETLETEISCPPDDASVVYYNENPALKGYDVNSARKLELRDASNKGVDGSEILVFHEGWDHYAYFKLTDDVPAMDALNDGVPCWMLGAGGDGADALYAPTFQRYFFGNIAVVEASLDFGNPRQLDIPGIRMADNSSLYEKAWKAFMGDRYNQNTKVMTCKVDFSGIQVGQDLLRKFYWYENSLWALNKIKNYSLTTYDPVECEFIQVQDKENYLNGQTFN